MMMFRNTVLSMTLMCLISTVLAETFLKEDCLRDFAEMNVCRATMARYWYDHKTKKCTLVDYGGCHETRNNFETLEECLRVTGEVCR